MADLRLCSISDCGKPVRTAGYCQSHYQRFKRHGDPLAGRTPEGEPAAFLESALGYEGNDCILWPYAKNPNGYAQIRLNQKTTLVTRIICERVHGPSIGFANEAAHTCNRGAHGCITKAHLVWKTRTENEADKVANGTSNRGNHNGAKKITAAEVAMVRQLIGMMPQKEIAALFGISDPHVSAIKKRTVWAHLP